MGTLDFLIPEDNGKPKEGVEYIYMIDDYDLRAGDIVIDVIQLENRGYKFKIKKNGKTSGTNYAWALAENTPENIIKIGKYNREFKKLKQYGRYVNSLKNDIVTLKPIK